MSRNKAWLYTFVLLWPLSELPCLLFGVNRPPEFEKMISRKWAAVILAATLVTLVILGVVGWWAWKLLERSLGGGSGRMGRG